jgi:hypothetical protein
MFSFVTAKGLRDLSGVARRIAPELQDFNSS